MKPLKPLRAKIARLIGPHGRRALTLITGVSAAQFIPIAIAPILTRLYSPEDYGTLATFASVCAILIAVVAGRYSAAALLPERESDAVQVTGIALFLAAASSLTLLLLVPLTLWLFGSTNTIRTLGGWLFLVPIAVFLGSAFESLGYFNLRKDRVREMARANVLKAGVSGGIQIALGALGAGLAGLLGGFMLGLTTGNSRLTRVYAQSLRDHRLSWAQMKSMAAKYSRFPRYDLWANLATALSYNVITLAIGWLYTYHSVGQYAIAHRLTALPSALLGVAIGQVYFREGARRVNSPALALRAFQRTLAALAAVSVVPTVALWLWAEPLFVVAFGPEWRVAGTLAVATLPLVWARFVASPLTSVFLIYGKQRLLLRFQLCLLLIILTTITAAFYLDWPLLTLLSTQSLLMAVFYAVVLIAAWQVVRSATSDAERSTE